MEGKLFQRWTWLWILLACSSSLALLQLRMVTSGTGAFFFLPWNLFLAALPLVFSSIAWRLDSTRWRKFALVLFIPWLMFLPNAPYILTDLLHLKERAPIPMWYDLLMLLSFGLNGLFLGYFSLIQMESVLQRYLPRFTAGFSFLALFLSAYGIYLGRFLRLNSWDVLSQPRDTAYHVLHPLVHPFDHPRMWAVTLIMGFMLWVGYQMIRAMGFNRQNS
jgi:uncharacterized membrane protein